MIKKKFVRKSPEEHEEHMMFHLGWVVLTHRLLPDKPKRRKLHGTWVKITSDNSSIYRVISFGANLKGTLNNDDPAQMVIDWVGWLKLYGYADNVDPPQSLKIRKLRFYEFLFVYFKHPEPFYRLTSWFSLIFASLGIFIGVAIS